MDCHAFALQRLAMTGGRIQNEKAAAVNLPARLSKETALCLFCGLALGACWGLAPEGKTCAARSAYAGIKMINVGCKEKRKGAT